MVAPEKFPFTTPTGATYDTGEYAAALDRVLAAAGYPALRAEQARRRERGDTVQLGLGLSVYVEITAGDMGGETARVVVDGTGAATVFTGSSAHGQGHHTAWAMLVQDELGIPMESDHRRARRHRRDTRGDRHLRVPVAAARRDRGGAGRG